MRKLPKLLAQSRATLICVNQVQDKIGGMPRPFMPNETVPGGRALKFRATLRLRMRSKGSLEEGSTRVGIDAWVKIVKSKIGPSLAEFAVPIRDDVGLDDDLSLAMYLAGCSKSPVRMEKGKVYVEMEDGKEVSAAWRDRGWSALVGEHKGLRKRLRFAVKASLAG